MGRFSDEVGSTVRPLETVVLDGYGVTKHELATPRWRRSSRGLYVPGDAPESVAQRIVSAAAVMPDDGAIGGWAAAHVRGADLDGRDRHLQDRPVDVLLPPGLHPEGGRPPHPPLRSTRWRSRNAMRQQVRGSSTAVRHSVGAR